MFHCDSGQRVQVPPANLIDDTLRHVSYADEHIYLEWNRHTHATVLSVADLQRSLAQCTSPRITPEAASVLHHHDFTAVNTDDQALLHLLDSLAKDGACLVNQTPSTAPGEPHQSMGHGEHSFGVVSLANRISQPQVPSPTPRAKGTLTPVVLAYHLWLHL